MRFGTAHEIIIDITCVLPIKIRQIQPNLSIANCAQAPAGTQIYNRREKNYNCR